ncbi:MAG: putative RDD family membrane protein YckC [Cellvibrionaceae bacterium]
MAKLQHPSVIRRFVILSYDFLLLLAVSMAYGLIYIAISKWLFGVEVDRATGLFFQLGWLFSIFSFFCYFWIRGGQTTGMRAWRVKLIGINKLTPGIWQCALRFLFATVGWIFFFTVWSHPDRQMLHDRWSDTRLILLPKEKK